MTLLTLFSLFPYVLLIVGESASFKTPPIEQLTLLLGSCIYYHLFFLASCRKMGFSVRAVTYFFFWIFLGFAPMMCSVTGRWLWGDITFEMNRQLCIASLLSLSFIVTFHIVHSAAFRRSQFRTFLSVPFESTDARLLIGLSFSVAVSIVVFAVLGVDGTFFRAGYDSYLGSGLTALFVQNCLRPLPLFVGVPLLWLSLRRGIDLSSFQFWIAIATVSLAVVVNFPLSVARFYGWMVICVFFYYASFSRGVFRTGWLAGIFVIGGFLGSFGADVFRSIISLSEARSGFVEQNININDRFYVGHVDAFEMLAYGVKYVEEKGVTMGRQLTGVVCFWVPRDLWPDKPEATGVMLGSSFINILGKTENVNLSAPIVLEGYINFGLTGALVFAIFFGYIGGGIDRAIVERRALRGGAVNLIYRIDVIAAPLLGLWVYLFRGSLLSTFAYSFSIVATSFVASLLFLKVKKTNSLK